MAAPIISTEEVKTYFCHTREYNVSYPLWPRDTILLLKYEQQTRTDVEPITEGVGNLPSTSNDSRTSRRAMMNPSPSPPTWKRFHNEPGVRHAEKAMIVELCKTLEQWQPRKPDENPIRKMKLDIYLSYSPCNQRDRNQRDHHCSNLLVAFKKFVENKGVDVEMNVKIANFYLIKEEENIRGLCLLLNNGINLELFQGVDDWENFFKEIGCLQGNETIREKWNDVDEHFRNGTTYREYADKVILEGLKEIAPFLSSPVPRSIPQAFLTICSAINPTTEQLEQLLGATKQYVRNFPALILQHHGINQP